MSDMQTIKWQEGDVLHTHKVGILTFIATNVQQRVLWFRNKFQVYIGFSPSDLDQLLADQPLKWFRVEKAKVSTHVSRHRQMNRNRLGLCQRCAKPLCKESTTYCKFHHDQNFEYYRKKKGIPLTRPKFNKREKVDEFEIGRDRMAEILK